MKALHISLSGGNPFVWCEGGELSEALIERKSSIAGTIVGGELLTELPDGKPRDLLAPGKETVVE